MSVGLVCDDPGVLFIDEINRHNPTPTLGRIEATNPCGEQPLLPYEACNLGSINLARLTSPQGVDWRRLEEIVELAVRFLDNVVDVGRYQLPEVERITRANRKIGLGIMGLAEALIALGIPYASDAAVAFAGQMMAFISRSARQASIALAHRRGAFSNCDWSVWRSLGVPSMRNATLTTAAPTGTLSIIVGTSGDIEPLFALAYVRSSLEGTDLPEMNQPFVAALEQHNLPVNKIVEAMAGTGAIQQVEAVPLDLRRIFQTALDVPAEWHVRLPAVVQQHTSAALRARARSPRDAPGGRVPGLVRDRPL